MSEITKQLHEEQKKIKGPATKAITPNIQKTEYMLPDGTNIQLDNEVKSKAPEILF